MNLGRPLPDHASGPRTIEVDTASLAAMLQRDHARMRKAGGDLAEAALRVIHDYDGLHRLSLAVAAWSTAIANEGDRPHCIPREDIDFLLAHDVRRGISLRETAKRHNVGVGRVRGAITRDSRSKPEGPRPNADSGSAHESGGARSAIAQPPGPPK